MTTSVAVRPKSSGQTYSDLNEAAVSAISTALNQLLAHSLSDVSRHQRLEDNNQQFVNATDLLDELRADNQQLTGFMRSAHEICAEHNEVATTSLIEVWIDQTEWRPWLLAEILTD